jgi:enoyl-CoA hydratase/carnithine racemase
MISDRQTMSFTVDAGVVFATILHPPLNFVSGAFVDDLVSLLDALAEDTDQQVLVFKSADPDYFLSRADITNVADYTAAAARSGGPGDNFLGTLLRRISDARVVTIAQIAGRVRGAGSELALACDMRFASKEKAIFGQPEVGVGLPPGSGALQHLPRLMGRGRALEALLSSEDYDAELAAAYGWVNRALPDAELDGFIDQLARRIAGFPPQALQICKQRVNAIALPTIDAVRSDAAVFQALARSDATRHRLEEMRKLGLDTRGDTEANFGRVLGEIR